ncbi:probable tRNA (uracil-O(2)-)-methyltransferase [Chironomus tepperi]|uniref:probable tRNA (uracil-O(2)-)-methyltransferase n=1 Tax=Chironomus tepperi TaxID=113505 RepID=UPI00391F2443
MLKVKDLIHFDKEVQVDAFYHAVQIYLKKPQVVNRKLNTSKNILTARTKVKSEDLLKILSSANETADDLLILNGIECTTTKLEDEFSHLDEHQEETIFSFDKIIPRNIAKHKLCFQLTIFCKKTNSVSFFAINDCTKILPDVYYTIKFCDKQLQLLLNLNDFEEESNWLQYVLIKKLKNWIESYEEDNNERIESHSLINDEEYSSLYAELKEKYGRKFEEIWTEEVTDPKKYIYEDIAIAAYLITFWKSHTERKPSFIDLGCGNGLLVAILSLEGYKGYGIDLRKRKIWSKFDSIVDLREETWSPSTALNDIDWIIGNHSDELSPWVPVVAARNNMSCNYFLLPCCAFEFSGTKFQRKGPMKSLYMSFIDYLSEISTVCGFKTTSIDRLKIPSTKRICLIGINRVYQPNEYHEYNEKIQGFIDASNKTFTPREKELNVRNCTKVDRNLSERIVRTIFDALLSEQNFVEETNWNCGKEMHLSDAALLISADDLKKLKSENGGLQTLLRNKHQIFEVRSGKLKIRKPKRIAERILTKKIVLKSSSCYFHLYHKQGCPLTDEECCYKH